MKRHSSINKSYLRGSIAGAAIFVIVVLHFVISQFISFESEKEAHLTEAINEQVIEIRPNYEAEKPDVSAEPKVIQSADLPSENNSVERIAPKQAIMKQSVIKKADPVQPTQKQPRESKSERLRRVEKFLTGI